jgi:hypothetical protein
MMIKGNLINDYDQMVHGPGPETGPGRLVVNAIGVKII